MTSRLHERYVAEVAPAAVAAHLGAGHDELPVPRRLDGVVAGGGVEAGPARPGVELGLRAEQLGGGNEH